MQSCVRRCVTISVDLTQSKMAGLSPGGGVPEPTCVDLCRVLDETAFAVCAPSVGSAREPRALLPAPGFQDPLCGACSVEGGDLSGSGLSLQTSRLETCVLCVWVVLCHLPHSCHLETSWSVLLFWIPLPGCQVCLPSGSLAGSRLLWQKRAGRGRTPLSHPGRKLPVCAVSVEISFASALRRIFCFNPCVSSVCLVLGSAFTR